MCSVIYYWSIICCCYNAILFSRKGNPAICDNMDETEDFMLSEISQTEKHKYYTISLTYGV